jgi:hypothetical protein
MMNSNGQHDFITQAAIPYPASEKLYELLTIIESDEMVLAAMLGGSQSYDPFREWADSDLFLLIDEVTVFEQRLLDICKQLPHFDVLVNQGYFPWTEYLYTIYYKDDNHYSIDICLISINKANGFFWEPNGILLFDKHSHLLEIRNRQFLESAFASQPFNRSNPFSLAVVTYKKIEKNLFRGHLWNGLELLNIMRRYYMQIVRSGIEEERPYLGRVDREIEDVIPEEWHRKLAETVAGYDAADIARKSMLLAKMLLAEKTAGHLNEPGFDQWISRQIDITSEKINELIQCTVKSL